MEINNILTASWLDILFDNRNKDYGAYELRKTYSARVGKALLGTTIIVGLAIVGSSFSGNEKTNILPASKGDSILLHVIEEKTLPKELPKPEVIQEQPAVQEAVKTIIFTEPIIVENDKLKSPTPPQEEVKTAVLGNIVSDGKLATSISVPTLPPGDGLGIVGEKKTDDSNVIIENVQVQAKFIGDWVKFLTRNLDPQVPLDNGAVPGKYTVIVQFVVDKEGNVSDIKPLTKIGFGMEEEAVRVLKKATRWEPGIQNGYKVKAYRQQSITFQVLED